MVARGDVADFTALLVDVAPACGESADFPALLVDVAPARGDSVISFFGIEDALAVH